MKKLLLTLLLLPSLAFAGKMIELNKNNTLNFNQDFNPMFVAKKQIEAMNLCAKNKGGDIYVTLYSPGGSISAGQLLFDTLKALPCNFHTITLFSASMSYQTVQNLGKRYILPSGILMSHRAQISGLGGELGGDLDEIIKLLKTNVQELEIIASKRVGVSLEEYRNQIRDELWMTAEEAVKRNHADEVVVVKCNADLMGTRVEVIRTFFGSFEVEFSNCPIITAPISFRNVNELELEMKIMDYLTNMKQRISFTL